MHRVVLFDLFSQHLCHLKTSRTFVGVVNFVSYAPHDDGGVVAVTAYPCGNVCFIPFGKETVIVVLILCKLPHIEYLAVYEQSHFVAYIHKFF